MRIALAMVGRHRFDAERANLLDTCPITTYVNNIYIYIDSLLKVNL